MTRIRFHETHQVVAGALFEYMLQMEYTKGYRSTQFPSRGNLGVKVGLPPLG